jgi:hypothetical protein
LVLERLRVNVSFDETVRMIETEEATEIAPLVEPKTVDPAGYSVVVWVRDEMVDEKPKSRSECWP